MLSLEKLNALRGIKTNKPTTVSNQKDNIPKSDMVNNEAKISSNSTPNISVEAIEIPCKNYMDEEGHFAYIDANTHKISHVNLNSGKIYNFDEIHSLSLKYILRALPDIYQNLKWEEVVSNNTLYDKFGYPMFTIEELDNALYNKNNIDQTEQILEDTNNKTLSEYNPQTDPWGLPL